MAKILYQPYCSNCGKVIEETVYYEEDYNNLHGYAIPIATITPWRCVNCGEVFTNIEIQGPRREVRE